MCTMAGRIETILINEMGMSVTFLGEKPTNQLMADVPPKPSKFSPNFLP